MVAMSQKGSIVGGYRSINCSGKASDIHPDNEAFIFSLTANLKISPVNTNMAVWCYVDLTEGHLLEAWHGVLSF